MFPPVDERRNNNPVTSTTLVRTFEIGLHKNIIDCVIHLINIYMNVLSDLVALGPYM